MNTLNTFRLSPPIEGFKWVGNISQMFGVNASRYNADFKIPGHNGLDIIATTGSGYGTPIIAAHDGVVVGTSSDLTRSRGSGVILQKILDDGVIVQTTYWHLSEINVTFGQQIATGQTIGKMGNTGYVFPEPSDVCIHCGTHLHFALSLFKNGKPLFTEYGNFVDPTPYLYREGDLFPMRLPWDLFRGVSNDTVSWLQTMLRLEGFAEDYIPIGCFGPKTQRDVTLLQKKVGIAPFFGYCGTKTRRYLNEKYSKFDNK